MKIYSKKNKPKKENFLRRISRLEYLILIFFMFQPPFDHKKIKKMLSHCEKHYCIVSITYEGFNGRRAYPFFIKMRFFAKYEQLILCIHSQIL